VFSQKAREESSANKIENLRKKLTGGGGDQGSRYKKSGGRGNSELFLNFGNEEGATKGEVIEGEIT